MPLEASSRSGSREGPVPSSFRWRVAWNELNEGFKVKTTSPSFLTATQHAFVLDAYRDGLAERGVLALFARYVGRSSRPLVARRVRLSVTAGLVSRAWEGGRPSGNGHADDDDDDEHHDRSGSSALLQSPNGGGAAVSPKKKTTQQQWPAHLARDATAAERTRVGAEALVPVELLVRGLDDAGDAARMLVFECCVDVAVAPRRRSSSNNGGFDDESARRPNRPLTSQKSSLTQHYRNLRFTVGVAPIVLRYVVLRKKAKKLRRRLKAVDREAYYEERDVLWDDGHDREAARIRRLFDRMGGLYNKLAQDFATRDGVLPAAWVKELRGSFEAMPPRAWSTMRGHIYDGLAKEGVPPANPAKPDGSLERYFDDITPEPLAAASIGQVHVAMARTSNGQRTPQRIVVKAIYPEIRKNLVADLANARRAAHIITTTMKLPMKGSIDAIMDEQCESFPRELDLRLEAENLERGKRLFEQYGLDVAVPDVLPHLSSSSVLSQTFCDGVTLATVGKALEEEQRRRVMLKARHDDGTRDDDDHDDLFATSFPSVPRAEAANTALASAKAVARAVGVTLFRDRWFHSDPHPGNVMLCRPDMAPALIDWGQCTTLDDDQLRTICHIVVLLAAKSKALVEAALQQTEFKFNTENTDHKVALLYYLFDSARSVDGVEGIQEAMEDLFRRMKYSPKTMPVLTDVPREMVFYGRVMGTLRKCFDILGADVSVIDIWKAEAKAALKRLNAHAPDATSTALLMLPADPKGLVYVVERAPDWLAHGLDLFSKAVARVAFGDGSSVGSGRGASSKGLLEDGRSDLETTPVVVVNGHRRSSITDDEDASPSSWGTLLRSATSSSIAVLWPTTTPTVPRYSRESRLAAARGAAALVVLLAAALVLLGPILRGLAALSLFFGVAFVAVTRIAPPLPYLRLFQARGHHSAAGSAAAASDAPAADDLVTTRK